MTRSLLGVVTALFVSATAFAAPITFDYRALLTTVDPPSNHVVPAGGVFDGVGRLLTTTTSNQTFLCSSALLNSGRHLLTAAHCVTDNAGIFDTASATVDFYGDSGTYTLNVGAVFLDPGWAASGGDLFSGTDIALLELTTMAPIEITRYGLYNASDEVGQTFTKVGYGREGTGLTGFGSGTAGTKRQGQNEYDTAGTPPSLFGGISSNVLLYDFDNGNTANDAWGLLGLPDLGLGVNEVLAAPGDSGGPNFIAGMIAAVTSFGFRYNFDCDGLPGGPVCSPDIDGSLNGTYGEVGGDTRVSAYAASINAIIGAPTPSTLILMLAAAPFLLRRRRVGVA